MTEKDCKQLEKEFKAATDELVAAADERMKISKSEKHKPGELNNRVKKALENYHKKSADFLDCLNKIIKVVE